MARKVTCVITKEKGTSDVFYKAENGKWYKSKELYEQSKYENKCREEIITRLCDYCGLDEGEPIPTLLFRRLKDLNYYSYEVTLETIKQQNNSIVWAVNNKHFNSVQNKISYIFAIISNNISDVNKSVKARKEQEKKLERKKPEEDIFLMGETMYVNSNPAVKDMSNWLEDD